MKAMLDSGAFNVAPHARRHPPMHWIGLFLSAILLATGTYTLIQSVKERNAAQQVIVEIQRASKRQVAQLRKEQTNPRNLELEKERMRLQASLHMSWDGIFDALELAAETVQGGVSILALTPSRVDPVSTHLGITALAANPPIMLAYIHALQQDARISEVEMTSQQLDEKAGPGVIRLQLQLVWSPAVELANINRPEQSSPELLPDAAKANTIIPQALLRQPGSQAALPLDKGSH